MQIEIAGQKAYLDWEYWEAGNWKPRRMTTAVLTWGLDAMDYEPVVRAHAECSPQDRFCKDIGRKISLHRLLQSMNLTKQQRRDVWNQYFDRRNK